MSSLKPVLGNYNVRGKTITFSKPPKTLTQAYKDKVKNIPKLLKRMEDDLFEGKPDDTKYELRYPGAGPEDLTKAEILSRVEREVQEMGRQPEMGTLTKNATDYFERMEYDNPSHNPTYVIDRGVENIYSGDNVDHWTEGEILEIFYNNILKYSIKIEEY